MNTWTIDGIDVQSGGVVPGASEDDECVVLSAVRDAQAGLAVVHIAPQPHSEQVDVKNDWLLHMYLQQVASIYELTFETDYKPTADDMPASVRKYVDACKRAESAPGIVY